MLRKIESALQFFSEKRDYVVGRPRVRDISGAPDLEALESKVDNKRKDLRREKAQDREDMIRREKEQKNDEKKLKQQQLVIFKGRPEMQRARKKNLRPKKKDDAKPSQEIIDQMRYLGLKVYDQG